MATYDNRTEELQMVEIDRWMQRVQEIIDSTPYDRNKVRFVSNLYNQFKLNGFSPCIVNDRYLELDGYGTMVLYHHKKEMRYTFEML